MLYIASDHGGFELKNFILEHLDENIIDIGPSEFDEKDDYPDYVIPMCKKMKSEDKGIVICRNGVGVSVVANKFQHIRCALSFSTKHIKTARIDDNANVLSLPADYISKEEALQICKAFLAQKESNETRHIRRLKKFEFLGEKVQN